MERRLTRRHKNVLIHLPANVEPVGNHRIEIWTDDGVQSTPMSYKQKTH
jgi:hypothetical protein